MLKKINELLSGLPMTLFSGLAIILSLVLKLINIKIFLDPAWISILINGIPLLYLSIWRIIFNKGISKISSALLISMAMCAAIFIGDIFAAAEVVFIMSLGAILEEKTLEKARQGLTSLMNLKPQEGRLIDNSTIKMVPVEKIKTGDILRILPGEKVPTDGKIINGETSIDQSIITGEFLPVDKFLGDSVFCGTINHFGTIDIEVTNIGSDSSLQKLIKLIEDAEHKQAPTQRIADKWASYLVPFALAIAIITYFMTSEIVRAVTVLVVFCPCALVLATPTAIIAAIGQATKHGVIIKSGVALEKMGKVNTVALDKTGTLSYGQLQVSDCISFDKSITESELLQIVASVEQKSEHPLAQAIVEHAQNKKLEFTECNAFEMFVGKGVTANIENKQYYCGNQKYITENSIVLLDPQIRQHEDLAMDGKACIFIANDTKVLGIIALSDVIRETANKMIHDLKKLNTDCVLLTGDNINTAKYFAVKTGIENFKSDLLPEEKVSSINELQATGKTVCMIGDGVNDAPALKIADVGIAMGGIGRNITVESSDVVFMNDNLENLSYLKKLSNATLFYIKLGITLSMTINFVAVALSVAGVLNPTTAAIVHNAGSVLIVLLAGSLYDKKF